jgi:hypothetical protein
MRRRRTLWGQRGAPGVYLVKERYRKLGLLDWTTPRTEALCQRLGVTVPELCAMAGLYNRYTIRRCIQRNRWSVPVALVFWLIEQSYGGFRANR